MSQTPSAPPPGWYADPYQAGRLRYWDGQAWTEHISQTPQPTGAQPQPPADWGSPTAPGAGYGQPHPPYAPAPAPVLAPSGLRRLPDFFSDAWDFLRLGWLPLLLVSLLLWAVPLVVITLLGVALIDIPAWIDAFSALFAHGHWGVIGEPGGPAVGAAAVAERLQAVIIYECGTPRTKHLMSNVDIEIESETRATARCCIMVMQAVAPELPLQAIFIGRYEDVFEYADGQWRFLSRDIHPDLIGRMDFHRSDMALASD